MRNLVNHTKDLSASGYYVLKILFFAPDCLEEGKIGFKYMHRNFLRSNYAPLPSTRLPLSSCLDQNRFLSFIDHHVLHVPVLILIPQNAMCVMYTFLFEWHLRERMLKEHVRFMHE